MAALEFGAVRDVVAVVIPEELQAILQCLREQVAAASPDRSFPACSLPLAHLSPQT